MDGRRITARERLKRRLERKNETLVHHFQFKIYVAFHFKEKVYIWFGFKLELRLWFKLGRESFIYQHLS